MKTIKKKIHWILGIGTIFSLLFSTSIAFAGECPAGLYTYKAKITKVYDGDTVTADVDLGFNIWVRGEKLRLNRIDTPEIRGAERKQGIISRDWLKQRILGKTIYIQTVRDKKGKYGRYLAEVYDTNCNNLNDALVANKLAVYKSY